MQDENSTLSIPVDLIGYRARSTETTDGYHIAVLGALNHPTHFYTTESVERLLTEQNEDGTFKSLFARRIAAGTLYGESEQFRQQPGQSNEGYFKRTLEVDSARVSHHIRKLWLDKDYGKNHPEVGNPNMAAIVGEVRSFGPYKAICEEHFRNPSPSALFAIRGVGHPFKDEKTGELKIDLIDITTFDLCTRKS